MSGCTVQYPLGQLQERALQQLSSIQSGIPNDPTLHNALKNTLEDIMELTALLQTRLGNFETPAIAKLTPEMLLAVLYAAAKASVKDLINLACTNGTFLAVYTMNKKALWKAALLAATGQHYDTVIILSLIFREHKPYGLSQHALATLINDVLSGSKKGDLKDTQRALKIWINTKTFYTRRPSNTYEQIFQRFFIILIPPTFSFVEKTVLTRTFSDALMKLFQILPSPDRLPILWRTILDWEFDGIRTYARWAHDSQTMFQYCKPIWLLRYVLVKGEVAKYDLIDAVAVQDEKTVLKIWGEERRRELFGEMSPEVERELEMERWVKGE